MNFGTQPLCTCWKTLTTS